MHQGIKKLLLAGAGHAHVHVLSRLALERPADVDITVVSPFAFQTYSGMTPGFVAGGYQAGECQIPLEPLIAAAGARWIKGYCTALDAAGQQVRVLLSPDQPDTTQTFSYDVLSVDTGSVVDRERLETRIPGASHHALIVRPIEHFVHRWTEVVSAAKTGPLSLAVVGAGAAGIELLLAAQQYLQKEGSVGSSFTLITGGGEPAADYPEGVRRRVIRLLRHRAVTVLREACVGVHPGFVELSSGATLRCDIPILAIGSDAPQWLQDSGLQCSPTGHLMVNAFQQSTSHATVFAAGDVATRSDAPHARSGVYAVRAGPPLAYNLLAALGGQPLKAYRPPRRTLNLISCGKGHAIASWGSLHAEGAWAWHWKDHIDRLFVAKYARTTA